MGKSDSRLAPGELRPLDRLLAIALAALLLLALALLAAGCQEPVAIYQVPGACVASGQRVLVLPFMDTRTFVDDNDPHRDDLGEYARDIYADALRTGAGTEAVEVLTPVLPRRDRSLTNAEIADLGRQHGADLVVAGQIFSFTETRAASIPPRAGMFVRVVAADDGALLFVGDHYQAAALPGAAGGRDQQARLVAGRLSEGLIRQAGGGTQIAAAIASHTALAMLAPESSRPAGNGADTTVIDPTPEPEPPPLFASIGLSRLDPSAWDEQIAPEVPPIIDFNDDLYLLAAAEAEPIPAPLPPPPEALDGIADDTAAGSPVAPDATAQMAEDLDLPAMTAGETVAPAEPDRRSAGGDDDEADLAVATDAMDGSESLHPASAGAGGASGETVADAAVPVSPDAAAAFSAAPAVDAGESAMVADDGWDDSADGSIDAFTAAVADSQAEEMTDDDTAWRDEDEPWDSVDGLDASYAARLTGDQLAADLFASDGEIWPAAPTVPATPVAAPSAALPPVPDAADPADDAARLQYILTQEAYIATYEAEAADPNQRNDAGDGQVLDPTAEVEADAMDRTAATVLGETAEALVDGFAAAAGSVTAETEAEDILSEPMAFVEDGPIISVPLAGEQPRPVRAAPTRAVVTSGPTVPDAAADHGAVRVLVLPYHDRENPNNLIANTGGGEVVTTLYGTQLAQDPGVRVVWDASGQVSHDRLVDRQEAVLLGQLVGADYVVRGQVVEFRRAQSVPSLYSAVISTAVLAAQIFFAEFSGVDVATEVYRVADGRCVMSRRDRSQQKYVVQAEKTVRKLAAGMAKSVTAAIARPDPEEMDPLIDTVTPVSVFGNPG
ncbi:MAG: hypothetical protein LIP77_11740 [Planctomycetes bacterium]|nr:hypothetical protein [Planctomycetota bacterium]